MRRIRIGLIPLVVLGALFLGFGNAQAADFALDFDDAVIDTGWDLSSLTPGVNNHNDVYAEPDDVVRLDGTIENGEITIPASGVTLQREVRSLVPFESYYTIDWKATTPFTGSFDEGTGQLELSGSLEQTLSQGGNTCRTGPLALKLSTESETASNGGERFSAGLDGSGTMVGRWTYTAMNEHGGADCDPEALSCYAFHHLATATGDVALSTDRGLKPVGPSSYDRCVGIPLPAGRPDGISISKSPGALGFGRARRGSYRLDLVAGKNGAAFNIGLGVPRWPNQRVHGSPLQFGGATATGTETFTPLPPPPVVPTNYRCEAGSSGYGSGYTVEMGPNSKATVTLPVELVASPWTRAPLVPRISISDFAGGKFLEVPPIAIGGRLGAFVSVWVRGQKESARRVIPRKPFSVAGHVRRGGKLEGRKVKLWAESSKRKRFLGIARINARGNFQKRVRGLKSASYSIRARLVGAAPVTTCGRRVSIFRPNRSGDH